MKKLTSKQTNELANNFLLFAQTIGEYRYKHYTSLTLIQNKKLEASQTQVLNYADDLYTLSTTLVLEDIAHSLSQITAITKNIKKSYESLENIQKGILIAKNIETLGASLLSLEPKSIVASLDRLKTIIEG